MNTSKNKTFSTNTNNQKNKLNNIVYDKKLINFPKFEKSEIKEAFDCFDISCGGTISSQELKFIFKSLGENVSEEEIEEMIKLADIEGKGQVNYKHFEEFIRSGFEEKSYIDEESSDISDIQNSK